MHHLFIDFKLAYGTPNRKKLFAGTHQIMPKNAGQHHESDEGRWRNQQQDPEFVDNSKSFRFWQQIKALNCCVL